MKRLFLILLSASLVSSCASPPHLDTTKDPCHDSRYIDLKAKGVSNLTPAELSYYLQKEGDCFTYEMELAKYQSYEEGVTQTWITIAALAITMGLVIIITSGGKL
jgi:hypothetical protein